MPKRKQRRKNSETAKRSPGWITTDDEEILRRRERAASEELQVDPLDADNAFYGSHRVDSNSGRSYRVEIRSLDSPVNSCDCPDHQVNGLGTCKHIEAVLQHRRKRAFKAATTEGSPYFEIFLDRRDNSVWLLPPLKGAPRSKAHDLLSPFLLGQ